MPCLAFRPEIRQYFVEGNTEGAPYDRNHRSIGETEEPRTCTPHPVWHGGHLVPVWCGVLATDDDSQITGD